MPSRPQTLIWLIFLIDLGALRGSALAQTPPDLKSILAAAEKTLKTFEEVGASWTARIESSGGAAIVRVTHTPDGRLLVLSSTALGLEREQARLIEKDDTWYVIESNRRGKYRPHEGYFSQTGAPTLFALAEPQYVQDLTALAAAKFVRLDGDIATYLIPPANPKAIQNLIDQIEPLMQKTQSPQTRARLQAQLRQFKDALAGTPLKIDVKTGLFAEFNSPRIKVTISDFKPAGNVPANLLDVPQRPWEDHASDPTLEDLNDLVMIGHNAQWRPGSPAGDFDGHLLHLKSGRLRRIPFEGALCMPGCFLNDRRRVVVTGVDAMYGTMRLVEIDLKTRTNRPLGGDELAAGMTLMPTLSPDGKTLAALHKNPAGAILDAQIVLIDLATGQSKPLGKPLDTAFLSWLPDSKGLLLLTRKYNDMNKPSTDTVSRMDLAGNITPLFPGDDPVLMPDGKTILYSRRDTPQRWWIRPLEGGDPRALGEGPAKLGFPTSSPDGKRVLMMHFTEDRGPRPVILELGKEGFSPVNVSDGLWAAPAWR